MLAKQTSSTYTMPCSLCLLNLIVMHEHIIVISKVLELKGLLNKGEVLLNPKTPALSELNTDFYLFIYTINIIIVFVLNLYYKCEFCENRQLNKSRTQVGNKKKLGRIHLFSKQ